MKVNVSCCFKFKLNNPCKKILKLFKFKLRKPLFIKRLRFRPSRCESNTNTSSKKQASEVLSVFRSIRRQPREDDQVMEHKNFCDAGHIKAPMPSPITPAYVRLSGATKREVLLIQNDVEDACRSFENYLVEMIAEEGKMSDLMDIEELLYCWKNLKSPVFIDLVCRFYGELCNDLFSNISCEDEINTPKRLMK
ncbi:transcription repressor OFP17-like [Nicotiana tabacum]|uniref:Transcription repressor OFP17-like n=2 Tax=Nicotiana TaxID=4085 RepID=A0A1S4C8B0_TOBAC|nr:PREDICTED: transcription repressor OFP17-like [Nicotiana sylvestris]XP_016497370.1 PREDICTED: transcription repressor OFP17-like [Nicotiana tabacum]